MKTHKLIAGMALTWAVTCGQVFAGPAVFSGKFTVQSPKIPALVTWCNNNDRAYTQLGPITVSQSGSYLFQDLGGNFSTLFVVGDLYSAPFDPDNPALNRLEVMEDHFHPDLVAGTPYYIVIQAGCDVEVGAWAFSITGPGEVTGDMGFSLPSHWHGSFTAMDEQTNTTGDMNCPDTYYDASPPMQVPASDRYWFGSATSWDEDFWLRLAVYEGSFDPANPAANVVYPNTWEQPLMLEAGVDYVFVVQPDCIRRVGDWAYVLTQSAPFEINRSVNGAYYDPATPGQGLLIDIMPETGLAFVADFTFDTQHPQAGDEGQVGALGNRWFTAQGLFQPGDDTLELPIYVTSGGLFNDPAEVTNTEAGTLMLDFSNGCKGGTRTVTLDSGVQAQSTFQRLTEDNVPLCVQQYFGAGVVEPWGGEQ